MNNKSLGVALGGGGLRGLAHIGVLQVLDSNHIKIDMIAGTSAGSIVAALYASGISAYAIEQLVMQLKPTDYIDYNISGLLRFILGFSGRCQKSYLEGVLKGDKLWRLLYRWTQGKKLQDCKVPLAIVSCDIDSGRQVVFTNQDLEFEDSTTIIIRQALLCDAVRASCSIPATFVPLHYNNYKLVDGGIKNIVPVNTAKIWGAQYIMGINLGQPVYEQKINGIVQIISRSLDILTYETSDETELFLADLIVYPDVGEIKLEDISQASCIIRKGRDAMRNNLEQLQNGIGF